MKDPMDEMLLVQLSQSEWELVMKFIARGMAKLKYKHNRDEKDNMHEIIPKLINQIY